MMRLLDVEVANWKVVALLGLATVLIVLRRRPSAVRVLLAGCLALGTIADAANTYFGYLPQVADVIGIAQWPAVPLRFAAATTPQRIPSTLLHDGGILTLHITAVRSRWGRGPHSVLVYLPPQYFSDRQRRFPVAYLLHGSPGRAQDWLRAGRMLPAAREQARKGRPMIVVMPPVSSGWLDDSECVDGRREAIESWITHDLVSAVDLQLRTKAVRAQRAVGGMSAGGYCALNIGLRHSADFGLVLDLSGFTGPTYDAGLRSLYGPQWRRLAGLDTPATYARRIPLVPGLQIRFDVSRSDATPRREMEALAPVLTARGVQTQMILRGGGHTYHAWVPALRSGLAWFAERLYPEQQRFHGTTTVTNRADVSPSSPAETAMTTVTAFRGTA